MAAQDTENTERDVEQASKRTSEAGPDSGKPIPNVLSKERKGNGVEGIEREADLDAEVSNAETIEASSAHESQTQIGGENDDGGALTSSGQPDNFMDLDSSDEEESQEESEATGEAGDAGTADDSNVEAGSDGVENISDNPEALTDDGGVPAEGITTATNAGPTVPGHPIHHFLLTYDRRDFVAHRSHTIASSSQRHFYENGTKGLTTAKYKHGNEQHGSMTMGRRCHIRQKSKLGDITSLKYDDQGNVAEERIESQGPRVPVPLKLPHVVTPVVPRPKPDEPYATIASPRPSRPTSPITEHPFASLDAGTGLVGLGIDVGSSSDETKPATAVEAKYDSKIDWDEAEEELNRLWAARDASARSSQIPISDVDGSSQRVQGEDTTSEQTAFLPEESGPRIARTPALDDNHWDHSWQSENPSKRADITVETDDQVDITNNPDDTSADDVLPTPMQPTASDIAELETNFSIDNVSHREWHRGHASGRKTSQQAPTKQELARQALVQQRDAFIERLFAERGAYLYPGISREKYAELIRTQNQMYYDNSNILYQFRELTIKYQEYKQSSMEITDDFRKTIKKMESEKAELATALEEAEASVAVALRAQDENNQTTKELRTELSAQMKRTEQLRADLAALRETLKQVLEQSDQSATEDSPRDADDLPKKLDNCEKRIKTMQDYVNTMKARNDKLEQELKQSRQVHTNLRNSIAELKNKIGNPEAGSKTLLPEITDLRKSHGEEMERERSSSDAKIQSLMKQVEVLQRSNCDANALQKQLATCEAHRIKLGQEMVALSKAVEAHKRSPSQSSLDSSEEDGSPESGKVEEELRAKCSPLERRVAVLSEAVTIGAKCAIALERRVAVLTESVRIGAKYAIANEKLESDLAAAKTHEAKLHKHFDVLQKDTQEQNRKPNTGSGVRPLLEKEIEASTSRIRQLEDANRNLNSELNVAKGELVSAQETRKRIRIQRDQALKKVRTLQQERAHQPIFSTFEDGRTNEHRTDDTEVWVKERDAFNAWYERETKAAHKRWFDLCGYVPDKQPAVLPPESWAC